MSLNLGRVKVIMFNTVLGTFKVIDINIDPFCIFV